MAEPTSFNIQVIGLDSFRRKLSTLRLLVKSPQFAQLMMEFVQVGTALAKQLAPKASYLLQSRISGEIRGLGTTEPALVWGVRNLKYARAMEEGSKGHRISARNKRFLYWTNSGVGNYKGPRFPKYGPSPHVLNLPDHGGLTPIVAHGVWHPGTKAQPYLGPVVQRLRPRLVSAMRRLLEEVFKVSK